MFRNDNKNFIEQIKVDSAGKSKILSMYIYKSQ